MGASGRGGRRDRRRDKGGWPRGKRALMQQIKYDIRTNQPPTMFSY